MKFVSLLIASLAICLLLASFAPSTQAADAWGDTLHWEFNPQEGILTISGTGEIQVDDYNIPWRAHSEQIMRVEIQEGITGIAFRPFSTLPYLQSVVLPQSLKSIGESAFQYCSRLTSVNLTHVTSIGTAAFEGSGLTSVTIPQGVTTISNSAFSGCKSLSTVRMHDGVTKIGSSAFDDCIVLRSVRMPSSLKIIEGSAFSGCSRLTQITFNEGLESLGHSAFKSCTQLETVTLPDSVQEIKPYCFYGCTALQSIHFGANFSKLSSEAIQNCGKLETFTISENNSHMTVHQNGLYSVNPRELVAIAPAYTGAHVIPDGTVSIGYGACYEGKLTAVTIPGTVKTIGKKAFCYCKSLKNVVLNEGVEVIDDDAFFISGVTEMIFPSTVEKIGLFAFMWCMDLKKITFNGSPPETNKSFDQISATVYYPGYINEWKDAEMKRQEFNLTYIPDCKGRHDLKWDVVKAPTCTQPGWHSEKWCIVCRQDVEEAGELPPTGHTFDAWIEVNAPTANKEGLARRTCTACGATEQKILSKRPATQSPETGGTQPPATRPSQPGVTEPPATEPPSPGPVATEPDQSTPTEPTGTKPSVPENTEPSATQPPAQTNPGPAPWISVVTIAIASILIGLVVSFLIFAFKKGKNK